MFNSIVLETLMVQNASGMQNDQVVQFQLSGIFSISKLRYTKVLFKVDVPWEHAADFAQILLFITGICEFVWNMDPSLHHGMNVSEADTYLVLLNK